MQFIVSQTVRYSQLNLKHCGNLKPSRVNKTLKVSNSFQEVINNHQVSLTPRAQNAKRNRQIEEEEGKKFICENKTTLPEKKKN